MKKYLELIVILFAIVGGTFGALQVFATNDDLKNVNAQVIFVSERLNKKILVDRLHAIEERIWSYEDKYGPGCERCTKETKEMYRKLKQELNDIERELEDKKDG